MKRHTARLPIAFGLIVFILCGATARAELPAATCEALKTEQAGLASAGVPQSMAQGPEWARANLSRSQLALIKRYIEVGEQITFRCEKLVARDGRIDAAEAEPKDRDDPAQPPSAGGAKAVPKRKAEPVGAPKAGAAAVNRPVTKSAPTRDTASPSASSAATGAVKPQPPRPVRKERPNDAFIPPPKGVSGLGGLDAQAKQ